MFLRQYGLPRYDFYVRAVPSFCIVTCFVAERFKEGLRSVICESCLWFFNVCLGVKKRLN